MIRTKVNSLDPLEPLTETDPIHGLLDLNELVRHRLNLIALSVHVKKDQRTPLLNTHRPKAVLAGLEVLDASQFGGLGEATVKAVSPAVVRTDEAEGYKMLKCVT